jgi:hypothetical protein
MPDGRRKRRFSPNQARRRWYAQYRSHRFCRRFGWLTAAWIISRTPPIHRSADHGCTL